MTTDTEKRKDLRARIESEEIVVAPGCGDVVTARLLETTGMQAIHASGSVAHRTAGYADAGLLTMTEMIGRITALAEGSALPIIADADTGFGGVANVVRTVREYERAGASAIHIEDQLTPKRPTHSGFSGSFITRAEMVDKIRAAVDTRHDRSLTIIARCDVDDWDEKLERLAACVEAGADCGWIAARDEDRIRELTTAVAAPCIGVLPPGMTLRQYRGAGAACALIPAALQIAALCAQRAVLEALKDKGSFAECLDAFPHIDEMRQFYLNQGSDELKRIEGEYSGLAP